MLKINVFLVKLNDANVLNAHLGHLRLMFLHILTIF
jgi:hypothetical protein